VPRELCVTPPPPRFPPLCSEYLSALRCICYGGQSRRCRNLGDGAVSGGLDTRDPVRDTEWQDRWLARDWLVTSSPWNRDEHYDTVVKSEKGSYDLVG
jgi:hypothetical protein